MKAQIVDQETHELDQPGEKEGGNPVEEGERADKLRILPPPDRMRFLPQLHGNLFETLGVAGINLCARQIRLFLSFPWNGDLDKDVDRISKINPSPSDEPIDIGKMAERHRNRFGGKMGHGNLGL